MPDNLKNRGTPDRDHISLNEEHEVRYWTQTLGVSREELERTVQSVGNSLDAVHRALTKEAVAIMGDAFDLACEASAQAGQPTIGQEVIASCIIELAKKGERRPQVLCDRALEALGLPGRARS